MNSLKNRRVPLFTALFILAGFFGYGAEPADAGLNGCWYEEGNPPACDICGYDCKIPGQQCCSIKPIG
jgi:hypothetical protein